MVGVRDLWLASHYKLLNDSENQILDNLLDILVDDDIFFSGEIQSLPFTFTPTKTHTVLRFIEHLEIEIEIKECIAIISCDNVKLHCVWVDARDLSYHNFENILPLDHCLRRKDIDSGNLQFQLTNIKRINESMDAFTGKLEGKDIEMLLKLDDLGLYQKPSNSATRGGERFIFSSPTLGKSLTSAVKNSSLLARINEVELENLSKDNYGEDEDEYGYKDDDDEDGDEINVNKEKDEAFYEQLDKTCQQYDYLGNKPSVRGRFIMVNPVFRCNRFSPNDSKFHSHMDTPYYDASRGHVSKYTVLIYLTSGEGDPALHIKGEDEKNSISIDKIEPMQVIIFNQRYEHEGSAFKDTNKVFLRTELIFRIGRIQHDPEISSLFSSAVYYTIQSVFQPQLAQHAHELYEKVNRAHWGVDSSILPSKNLLLHKTFFNGVNHSVMYIF